MVLVNRNVAPSFNTIIEILPNDQRKIKLIRKYENTRKKIINNECAILFNKTCINESLLPKYIYIYIYIYKIELPQFYARMKTKTVLESLKDFLQNVRIFFLYFLFRFQLKTNKKRTPPFAPPPFSLHLGRF